MPLRTQTDVHDIERVLNLVLDRPQPPVGRCRLLSSGFAPHHTLKISEDIAGSKACLGCGNCIDICPVLAREPRRRLRTEQRTSLALEALVGEDCDRCYNCVLVCPQVDTTIKHYVVNTRLAEGMAQLLTKTASDETIYLDLLMAQ
jgi:NAD-dependent dihydropyrimidine dehydrogenase PreA subunit